MCEHFLDVQFLRHSSILLYLICGRFGVRVQDLPHPEVDWNAFYARISELNDKEPLTWSTVTKAPAQWINMKSLTNTFAPHRSQNKKDSGGIDLATSRGVDLADSCCTVA